MLYLNPYQPQRSLSSPLTGNDLYYRTHINLRMMGYNVFHNENILTQMKLYRWAKSEDYANGIAIADLHSYLFSTDIGVSKRRLGQTIKQAVAYDPCLLKGKTKNNDKPRQLYVFSEQHDLIFGLEWMICMWLTKIYPNIELEDELVKIAMSSDVRMHAEYVTPMVDWHDYELNWMKLKDEFNLGDQERKLVRSQGSVPKSLL